MCETINITSGVPYPTVVPQIIPPLFAYLPKFIEALEGQLREDEQRWGNTWLKRTRAGQEQRIQDDYNNYFDQFHNADTPIPWLKVIGNAYIAWVRENNPDLFPE